MPSAAAQEMGQPDKRQSGNQLLTMFFALPVFVQRIRQPAQGCLSSEAVSIHAIL